MGSLKGPKHTTVRENPCGKLARREAALWRNGRDTFDFIWRSSYAFDADNNGGANAALREDWATGILLWALGAAFGYILLRD